MQRIDLIAALAAYTAGSKRHGSTWLGARGAAEMCQAGVAGQARCLCVVPAEPEGGGQGR